MKKSSLITGLVSIFVIVAERIGLFEQWWGFTPSQEVSFAILVIAALLWVTEAVPLFVTSFIIIALQALWLAPTIIDAGGEAPLQIFLSPFFSNIILLFLGGFVLSSSLHKYHLDQRVARIILSKTSDNPARLLLSIIAISSILSMWMSNTATAAMMFAIVLPIIGRLPPGAPFAKAIVLAIPFACNLGGLGTPIGTPPNAIAITYLSQRGFTLSFLDWILMALPIVVIALFGLWRLLLKVYPPADVALALETENHTPIKKVHYLVIAIFLATCLGWLTTQLHGIPTGIVALLPVIVFFGLRLMNNIDFRTLSWDVLFMLGGGLSLGVGLKASGLTTYAANLIPSDTSFLILLIAFALLGALMSTFISNTATANLLIPLAITFDVGFAGLVVTLAMVCSSAMALPVSTPPNAIAFGSGLIQSRDMFFVGAIVTLGCIVLIILAYHLYWVVARFI